jgi:pimeloyl-ACP methyl ester carboxylesterase
VRPQTRYAKSGGVHIAYQVFGEGALDLVLVPGFISHVEFAWEEPGYARFLERLASFFRVVLFDKRGTGMSDPVDISELPTLEQRMDDVRAVLDAIGSDRAALFGWSEGGALCLLFAATYPERTAALILFATTAKLIEEPGYSGVPEELFAKLLEVVDESWGEGLLLSGFSPTVADDERFGQWWARYQRLGASPGAAHAILEMEAATDVRDTLSAIRVPTLILHRKGDSIIFVEQGRYLADRITAAKFVELPGADHIYWSEDQDLVLGEIQEFLTGVRDAPEPDRILTTILFTDMVGSTKKLAKKGDALWRDLLLSHVELAGKELGRFHGRLIETTGDGIFAAFDGPARAVRCARELVQESVRSLGVEIRAGVHTGECEVLGDKTQWHRRPHRCEGNGGVPCQRSARIEHREGPYRWVGDRIRGPWDALAEGCPR